MSLDLEPIANALQDHALASGLFERVNGNEPKNAPGNGITAATWVQRIAPEAEQSGLAATSARLTLNVRVYTNMLSEPQDAIDPNIVRAVDHLMNAYTGDFTLGGLVSHIDLLGQGAQGMFAEAGYIEMDKRMYRVMTITVPAIVNDVWEQSP